jgi:hypothetical protein
MAAPRMPRARADGSIDKAVFNEYVANAMLQRQAWIQTMIDPRRDINFECGYPDTASITAYQYRELYDRESIATRAVQVLPNECWQLQPEVYEDENSENVTLFEQAWDDLGKSIRGESFYQDEQANPIWEVLKRADVLSGVGCFGVILLGLDDGKPLREPIEGFQTENSFVGTDAQYYVNNYISVPDHEIEDDDPMLKRPGAVDPDDAAAQKADPLPKRNIEPEPGQRVPDEAAQEEDGEVDPHDPHALLEESEEDPLNKVDPQAEGPQDIEPHPENAEWQANKRKLLYIRAFDESLIQITQYENRRHHPRFGMPIMYRVTFNDPADQGQGIGLDTSTEDVHWSRIIHLADNRGSSEVMGVPRMRPIFNRLSDLRKLYGGSAEMYWRGAFPGLAFETHPTLGSEAHIDHAAVKDQVEDYQNTLQRYLAVDGVTVNSISPQVVDPTPHIDGQITAVCILLGVPKRIFMGSEQGSMASGQDDGTWNGRLKERQTNYITPRIIIPFIDRLIQAKVLPEPIGFSVVWPELDSATPLDKANIANFRTTALTAYLSGGGENLMSPKDFLVRIMGFKEKEAEEVLNATLDHMAEVNPMGNPDEMVPGHAPPQASTTFDEEGNPIPVEGGLPGDKTAPGDSAGGGKPPFGGKAGAPGSDEDPDGEEAGGKKNGIFGRNPANKGKKPAFSQNAASKNEISHIIDSACRNAFETVAIEKAAPVSKMQSLALSSIDDAIEANRYKVTPKQYNEIVQGVKSLIGEFTHQAELILKKGTQNVRKVDQHYNSLHQRFNAWSKRAWAIKENPEKFPKFEAIKIHNELRNLYQQIDSHIETALMNGDEYMGRKYTHLLMELEDWGDDVTAAVMKAGKAGAAFAHNVRKFGPYDPAIGFDVTHLRTGGVEGQIREALDDVGVFSPSQVSTILAKGVPFIQHELRKQGRHASLTVGIRGLASKFIGAEAAYEKDSPTGNASWSPHGTGGKFASQGKGQSRAERAARREARQQVAGQLLQGKYRVEADGRIRAPNGTFVKKEDEDRVYKAFPQLRPPSFMPQRDLDVGKVKAGELKRMKVAGSLRAADVSAQEVVRLTGAAMDSAINRLAGNVPTEKKPMWKRAASQARESAIALARVGGAIARESVSVVVQAYVAKGAGMLVKKTTGVDLGPIPVGGLFDIKPAYEKKAPESIDEWYDEQFQGPKAPQGPSRAEWEKAQARKRKKGTVAGPRPKGKTLTRPTGGGYWSGSVANVATEAVEEQLILLKLREDMAAGRSPV